MKSIQEIRRDVERRVQAELGNSTPSLLARALTPAIYLHAQQGTRGAHSHRGGQPQGVNPWPEFGGTPQTFLLAIRLSELRPFDQEGALPREGWLNFFIASEVAEGMAPLDACAVIHVADEAAQATEPPTAGLCFEHEGLTFRQGIHSVLQDYEFGNPEEYDSAFAEFEALGFETLPEDVEALEDADYLLGKQMYSTAAGVETTRDISAFTRQRHGREGTRLRALLTLRRDTGVWPFFQDNSLMSLTFFIEAGDLQAYRFDRVIVDTTSD